jgi:hypothetical protein
MFLRIDSLTTTSLLVVLIKSIHHLPPNLKKLLRHLKPKLREEVSRNSSKMNQTPVASNQQHLSILQSNKKRSPQRFRNPRRPEAKVLLAARRQQQQ